ncbi:MAG: leucyl aminopeptidase family protein [Bacteroidota bacterium]
MELVLQEVHERPVDISVIYVAEKQADFTEYTFTTTELEYIKKQIEADKKAIDINSYFKWSYVRIIEVETPEYLALEKMRKQASELYGTLKKNDHEEILVVDVSGRSKLVKAFLEGLVLSHYQFLKYKTNAGDKKNVLKRIQVLSEGVGEEDLNNMEILCSGVYHARDLVNEPLSRLNALQLGEKFQELAGEAGFTVDVFNKKKIESLRLYGLLAVNRGSLDPPTFTVMEWKPDNPGNEKPIVLVGKGIVYDTGGISLKPTSGMLDMKSDMAGGATVAGVMYAAARSKLPVHLIGLVPATDNRPDGNAYTPGDVITMHSEKTVEVINTDAEGRMILADALSFAKQYDPELVFDFATLTGSASVAIGPQGIVAMGNTDRSIFDKLVESGKNAYERIVELPLWEEYNEMIKSEIADIKNVGGREAGAITAGKFLEHFTDYPWIHFDIAPTAYLDKNDAYRPKGGTGIGVRLMYDFLKNYKL